LRSPFVRSASVVLSTPPGATASSHSEAESPPTNPRPGPAPDDVGAELNAAIDRAAIRMLKDLDNDTVTPAQLRAGLQLATDLQKQREKRNQTSDDDGVEALKELMDPAKAVDRLHKDPQFIDALKAKGWLAPLPPRRLGRPSDAEKAVTDQYAERRRELEGRPKPENDDSGLRKMIGGEP
jgi:hypothetical protein